jgi:hypothetical protein
LVYYLPVGLYGCEIWSLTLGAEFRLRVLENMVLRTTFGPTREVIRVDWRQLRNEELHNLSESPSYGECDWTGHVACVEAMNSAHRALVRKLRPLRRPSCRCEDNIKIDVREIRYRGFGLDSSGLG